MAAAKWTQGFNGFQFDTSVWMYETLSTSYWEMPGVVPTPEGEWAIFPIMAKEPRNGWFSYDITLEAKLALCGPERYPVKEAAMLVCYLTYRKE